MISRSIYSLLHHTKFKSVEVFFLSSDVWSMSPPVLCLQVWASSLWSWVWSAPSAAAATPRTLHAHATNWWTWRWTDKHFPPHPHTAALTGNTTHTTDTRPRTISGTPSCFRVRDVGNKAARRSGDGSLTRWIELSGSAVVERGTFSLLRLQFLWRPIQICGASSDFFFFFFVHSYICSLVRPSHHETLWRTWCYIFEEQEALRHHCHLGIKEHLCNHQG